MKIRKTFVVAVVWIASLLAVGLWAQGTGISPQPAPIREMGEPYGEIITAENIGFQRIAAPPDKDGKVIGRLVVRINDKWREVALPTRIVR